MNKKEISDLLTKEGIKHSYSGKLRAFFVNTYPENTMKEMAKTTKLVDVPFTFAVDGNVPVTFKEKLVLRQDTHRTGLHKDPQVLFICSKKGKILATKIPKRLLNGQIPNDQV